MMCGTWNNSKTARTFPPLQDNGAEAESSGRSGAIFGYMEHQILHQIFLREPLMGKIYELDKIKTMHIERIPTGGIIAAIQTKDGKKVKLRLTGDDASAWAAKFIYSHAASAGHHSHPKQIFKAPEPESSESSELTSQEAALVMSTATAPSESNHSKFSYSITLPGSEASADEAGGSGQCSSRKRGDVPSLILSRTETDRAQGGKVSDDVNLSDLVHSILTSSSRSSDKNAVRDQLDELIRRHLRDGNDQYAMDLSPSARKDAAALRISRLNSEEVERYGIQG